MEKSLTDTYYTKVEKEGDAFAVIFPHELLERLNLEDKDILKWEINGDRIILEKVHIKVNDLE